jgi:hypothetical protein
MADALAPAGRFRPFLKANSDSDSDSDTTTVRA